MFGANSHQDIGHTGEGQSDFLEKTQLQQGIGEQDSLPPQRQKPPAPAAAHTAHIMFTDCSCHKGASHRGDRDLIGHKAILR